MALIKTPSLACEKFRAEATELDIETGLGSLRAVLAETNSLSELYAFLTQWHHNGCEVDGEVFDQIRGWRYMTLLEYLLLDLLFVVNCRDQKGGEQWAMK